MDLKKINKKRDFFRLKTETGREKTHFEKRAETLLELAETNSKQKKLLGISGIVHLIQFIAIIYLAIRTDIRVLLIQVDKTTGAVLEKNVVTKSTLEIGEKETKYFISKFILDVRTLPKDPAYYDNKLKENAFFLTQNSQKKLDSMLREQGIIEMLSSGITTNVSIVSSNKLTNSSNTYQVRWKEKHFTETGEEIENVSYLGVFTVDYIIEKSEENPLGILIKDFTISKENNQ